MADRCGKYLGDNDATCPQLTCIRERGHSGLCNNVSGETDYERAIRLVGKVSADNRESWKNGTEKPSILDQAREAIEQWERATPGPWRAWSAEGVRPDEGEPYGMKWMSAPNATAIAAARTREPALAAAVLELHDLLGRLLAAVDAEAREYGWGNEGDLNLFARCRAALD